jgi:hypothetical protein
MSNENGFDFDHWMKLAKEDPEAFEKQREAAIGQYLTSVPSEVQRDRLKRLQWRVDKEREMAKTPMDAAIRIYDMMWESVGKNIDALQDLADTLTGNLVEESASKKEQASILPFRKRTGTQG